MHSLNTSLISGSPRVAALLALLLGLVTAGPFSSLFGAIPLSWLWGLLLGASIWLGVAAELNDRPRKTLCGITPAQAMQRLLFDPEKSPVATTA